jgi:hypothetical protein
VGRIDLTQEVTQHDARLRTHHHRGREGERGGGALAAHARGDAGDVVTGPYDIVAVLEGADTTALGKLVLNELHGTPGLTNTTTLIALS